jgi:hypothetical protein
MLPDLRIVIAAVVSTFILTVGAGFVLSSRLMHEQIAARDGQGMDDAPIRRIALSWPEPNRFEPAFDLDAAISARSAATAARNPVRDITVETAAREAAQALTIPATTPSAVIAADAPSAEAHADIAHEPAEGTPSPADVQDDTHDNAQVQKDSAPTQDAARTEDAVAAQDETAATAEPESTGTIAATPAADIATSPDDTPAPVLLAPIPSDTSAATAQDQARNEEQDEAQKLAAHPAMQDEAAAQAEKPAASEPAKNNTATRKKRARKVARRPAAPHAQPAQPAPQTFNLFGLRTSPATPAAR